MPYLHRNNAKGKRSWRLPSLAIVFTAILIFIYYSVGSHLSAFFIKTLVPIPTTMSKFFSNIVLGSKIFLPKAELLKENEVLKERLASFESISLGYSLLKEENSLLEEKLGILSPGTISASLLLSPPQMPFDTILVDQGKSSGVSVGSKVFLENVVALGFAEEVYDDLAKIRMYSSPGVRTSAIHQRDGALVELEGRGGENFFLEAPLGFPIEEGDVFLLPGSKLAALAIASKVKKEESSSFISILLQVPIGLSGSSLLTIENK